MCRATACDAEMASEKLMVNAVEDVRSIDSCDGGSESRTVESSGSTV